MSVLGLCLGRELGGPSWALESCGSGVGTWVCSIWLLGSGGFSRLLGAGSPALVVCGRPVLSWAALVLLPDSVW